MEAVRGRGTETMSNMVNVVTKSPKRFVASTWLRVTLFFVATIAGAATLVLHKSQGWSLTVLGLSGLALLAVAGFIESLLGRVELHPDKLIVVSNFRKREYSHGQFKRVT
jgi:hypothetical protein